MHTLKTFCVPPGYNFLNPCTPNIIFCIPLCYNFHTLELFAYPLELFTYPLGLKYPRLRNPGLDKWNIFLCDHLVCVVSYNFMRETRSSLMHVTKSKSPFGWKQCSKKKIMNVALVKTRVLCILTSKWVIRTPFAGWNHCFCVKTNFPQESTSFWVSTSVLCMFFVICCIFLPFFPICEGKRWKNLF